jgi:type II secretory ATPase GspE/PulE/Tfp pilus assembly ATPase PilB-like protein
MNIGIAQRLARRICDNCKTKQDVAKETIDKLKAELAKIPKRYIHDNLDPENPVFYYGKGCAKCHTTGYIGRVAVAEIFQFTEPARRLIEEGFPMARVLEEATRQEMITIRQDTLLKALEGYTTVEEVFRLAQETEESNEMEEEQMKKKSEETKETEKA